MAAYQVSTLLLSLVSHWLTHCRRLELQCQCMDSDDARDIDFSLETKPAKDEDILCAAFDSPLLQDMLLSMPRLASLTLWSVNPHNYGHGLSWRRLNAFLSLPHLQTVTFLRFYVSPRLPNGQQPQFGRLAPLSSFTYDLHEHRRPMRLPAEEQSLAHLMHAVHSSLSSICLPAEPAPIQTISVLHWPQLRELRMYGER